MELSAARIGPPNRFNPRLTPGLIGSLLAHGVGIGLLLVGLPNRVVPSLASNQAVEMVFAPPVPPPSPVDAVTSRQPPQSAAEDAVPSPATDEPPPAPMPPEREEPAKPSDVAETPAPPRPAAQEAKPGSEPEKTPPRSQSSYPTADAPKRLPRHDPGRPRSHPAEPQRFTSSPEPRSLQAQSTSSPASASPPPASPVGVAWQQALATWLAANKTYPDEARRQGAEGTVVIRFTVSRSGRVLRVELVRSAGSAILDEAAEAMLQRAELPPLPATMTQDTAIVTVQLHYALTR